MQDFLRSSVHEIALQGKKTQKLFMDQRSEMLARIQVESEIRSNLNGSTPTNKK